jgi:hypothetical protein
MGKADLPLLWKRTGCDSQVSKKGDRKHQRGGQASFRHKPFTIRNIQESSVFFY